MSVRRSRRECAVCVRAAAVERVRAPRGGRRRWRRQRTRQGSHRVRAARARAAPEAGRASPRAARRATGRGGRGYHHQSAAAPRVRRPSHAGRRFQRPQRWAWRVWYERRTAALGVCAAASGEYAGGEPRVGGS
eukprot:3031382-Prymnesium_polylepis.1